MQSETTDRRAKETDLYVLATGAEKGDVVLEEMKERLKIVGYATSMGVRKIGGQEFAQRRQVTRDRRHPPATIGVKNGFHGGTAFRCHHAGAASRARASA
jgi:hypothetical protein